MADFEIKTEQDRQDIIYYIQNMDLGQTVSVKKKRRTLLQNAALNLYSGLLAEKLNDAGIDKKTVYSKMKRGYSVPWSQESVKEDLWRPIQMAMFKIRSTTKLNTSQVSEVHRVLDNWTATELGVSLTFPSREKN